MRYFAKKQYQKVEKYLPVQRGNVKKNSNLRFLNSLLYIAKNACKWRKLPKKYGNWHTIYVRFNRWSKNGVLERVFSALQSVGIINVKVKILCLDSTSIKVHPDACGTLKKTENKRMEEAEAHLPQKFIWLPHLTEQH